MQPEYAIIPGKKSLREPDDPKKSDAFGHQLWKSGNGMVSKFKMLPTTASRSRTIDEMDGVTAG